MLKKYEKNNRCSPLSFDADGGGFTADVYNWFVPLGSVLSASRRSDWNALLTAVVAPVNPTDKEAEDAPSNGG